MSNQEPSRKSESSASFCIERRAYVRLVCDLPANVQSAGPRREVGRAAKVRDISNGGVQLFLVHRFRPGTDLEIEIRDRAGSLMRTLKARVAYTKAVFVQGNHGWQLGCQFHEPLDDDEFEVLREFFKLKRQ